MKIQVLDCTLRDGGYINDWNFGKVAIGKIIDGLVFAGVDIIECGFLSDNAITNANRTFFANIQDVDIFLPKNANQLFTCMINYGDYNIDKLPNYRGYGVGAIRVVFHKKSMCVAVDYADKLALKGYKVFLQPMVTGNYTDEELISLTALVDKTAVSGIYLVDSFGVMRRNDLMRLFYLFDNNLRADMALGFHSHNNIQLSYSNAQALLEVHTDRELIVDVAVGGMGRGAGNLNSELFLEYLNTNYNAKYNIQPLLKIIYNYLDDIYKKTPWGYSIACYLSSKYNCHPYYATFLRGKKELELEEMESLLRAIPEEKLESYDNMLIEKMYREFISGKI